MNKKFKRLERRLERRQRRQMDSRQKTSSNSPKTPSHNTYTVPLTDITNTVQQHSAVLNLGDTPPDPALERVSGLGPSFRPTHRLVTDNALKAVMTVVTLCDGNVTNRHDVTVNL